MSLSDILKKSVNLVRVHAAGVAARAGGGFRRGGRGGADVGGGARGAEAAVRAAGDPAQQDAAPRQPAHQPAPRRQETAAQALLAASMCTDHETYRKSPEHSLKGSLSVDFVCEIYTKDYYSDRVKF